MAATIGIKKLIEDPEGVIDRVERDGEPLFITRNGRPTAAIVNVDEEMYGDYLVEQNPAFIEAAKEYERSPESGESLAAILAE